MKDAVKNIIAETIAPYTKGDVSPALRAATAYLEDIDEAIKYIEQAIPKTEISEFSVPDLFPELEIMRLDAVERCEQLRRATARQALVGYLQANPPR